MKYAIFIMLLAVTPLLSQSKKDTMPEEEKKEKTVVTPPFPSNTKADESEIVKKYDERLKDASNTISFLNSTITVLGILIVILTIGLPYMVYQIGEKVEEKMDKRIDEYLNNYHKKQVAHFLDKLESKNVYDELAGVNFFKANFDIQLNEEQLYRMIDVLKTNVNHLTDTDLDLGNYLAYQKSKTVDRYFKELLLSITGNRQLKSIAVAHFIQEDYKNDLSLFEQALDSITVGERGGLYYGMVTSSRINDTWVLPILNSKTLVDKIELENLKIHQQLLKEGYNNLNETKYQNTYFFQKK